MRASAARWHDLEIGEFRSDLSVWSNLALRYQVPTERLVDFGAGTGRVSIHLAREGWRMTAVESDECLISALRSRISPGLDLQTICADVRRVSGLEACGGVIAPMLLIHLMGSQEGRTKLLDSAAKALRSGGWLGISLDPNLPRSIDRDAAERSARTLALDGNCLSSKLLASGSRHGALSLVTARESNHRDGLAASVNEQRVDHLTSEELVSEARSCGFEFLERVPIAACADSGATEVVVFSAS